MTKGLEQMLSAVVDLMSSGLAKKFAGRTMEEGDPLYFGKLTFIVSVKAGKPVNIKVVEEQSFISQDLESP